MPLFLDGVQHTGTVAAAPTCRENDPHELNDLAGDARYADELRKWRSRLVEHLQERGEPFVKNGDLALRPESYLYSPDYPGCSCHPKA